MDIESAPSPNYTTGRKGRQVIAIVNHITAGLMPGTLSWLQNTAAQASAHYLVAKDGVIYQLVEDENTAWHAGIVNNPDWALYDGSNPNYYTIGIEHECLEGGGLTEEQYQSTLWLHKLLINKWSIAVDTDHIIGHYRLDSVNRANDPGPDFPWNRLLSDLKGGDEVPEWMRKIMEDARAAGLITGEHSPLESATKWFVLAIALKVLDKIKG